MARTGTRQRVLAAREAGRVVDLLLGEPVEALSGYGDVVSHATGDELIACCLAVGISPPEVTTTRQRYYAAQVVRAWLRSSPREVTVDVPVPLESYRRFLAQGEDVGRTLWSIIRAHETPPDNPPREAEADHTP